MSMAVWQNLYRNVLGHTPIASKVQLMPRIHQQVFEMCSSLLSQLVARLAVPTEQSIALLLSVE